MDSELYFYLNILGFNNNDLNIIEEKNCFISEVDTYKCEKVILFLQNIGLNLNEIRNIILKNPYLLSEKELRLKKLDKIYNSLNFSDDDKKILFLSNPEMYSVNPIELENLLKYMFNNLGFKNIKQIILKNSFIIGFNVENMKKFIENKI